MDSDAWTQHFSATSKRHQSALQSRLDQYLGFEEIDGEDDLRPQFPCPFCFEDLDIVSLCCHIEDEHSVEAKNGVCPICANRVGSDLVSHIHTQHGNFFKMQRRRRFRKSAVGSHSMLSLLRKELRDGHLQSLFRGSSVDSSSNTAPDPLLSSFIYNFPTSDGSKSLQPESLDEGISVKEILKGTEEERKLFFCVKPPPLSDKDQKERVQRSEFVQGLLMSTILDEGDW